MGKVINKNQFQESKKQLSKKYQNKKKKLIGIYISLTNENETRHELPIHLLHNVQLTILERHPTQGSEVPAPAGDAAEKNRGRRKTYMTPSSSGRRPRCTCLSRPGLAPCRRHGYMLPKQSMRRYGANKEVLRRALAPPPNRKMTVRWWNFKPTPSRLSNMSMA
ncbi:hypothetical protein V6N11_042420 [Hibiscus sabdariffa]|uniref:Uncharacterized protein n=1 Tax=Hibiscus sabdariffa TaxID=183260 RepID=A0ABR2QWN6_9ROSI